MEDFHKIGKQIDSISLDNNILSKGISGLQKEQDNIDADLDGLKVMVNELLLQVGEQPIEWKENELTNDINSNLHKVLDRDKIERDKEYELNKVDILVACFAGVLGVLVDFLVVKIPKDVKFQERFDQKGSPLTSFLRKIGVSPNNEKSKWVEALEQCFKVNYDLSINENVKGMCPKKHRLYSIAHDPSPVGLLFAIKDLAMGTFSYIDKDGFLRVIKVGEVDFMKLFRAPIKWLGHIISDLFTSMGIPVPGHCLLRMLQFGSFGEKNRTVAAIAEYMYLSGYDMRHLATMSTSNLVINLVIKIYHKLLSPYRDAQIVCMSDSEYYSIKNNIKLHNMLFTAYSVAACGNIAKVCVYEGNPTAINYAIWAAFAKEALAKAVVINRNTKSVEQIIEGRHVIDDSFDYLFQRLSHR